MLNHGTLPDGVSGVFFRQETKCCTYQPSVPNYLIGALLSDTRPELGEGQKRVRAHIKTRIGITPQWVGPSAKYEVLYDASMRTSFGRNLPLKCTYYDDGKCTIWKHRETICSTFFCKFSSGALASNFWKALKDYLCYMEGVLARWSMQAVTLDVNEPNAQRGMLALHELEDRPPPDALYKKWWGPYVDKEDEFYIACFEKVKTLNREKYASMVDSKPKGRELLTACMTAYAAVGSHKLPARVQLNPKARALPVVNGSGVIVTAPYNPYDSVLMESELYQVLRKFKHDKTVAETRKTLREEEGVELEDALLESFSRHQILVGPDEKDAKR
jgi:Fe-S-cluster containining protein